MAQSSSAVAFVQMAPLSQQPAAFLQSTVPAASPPGGAWGAAVPQTPSAAAAGSSSTVVLAAVGVLAAAVVSGGSRFERRGARRANNNVVARRFFNFGGGDEPKVEAKPVFDPSVQLGAMEPLGFFDPLGYCAIGDEDGFRKFRAAEIKHGRVCMMASTGLVAQHFAGTGGVVKGSMGTLLTESGAFGITVILVFSAFLELSWPENPDKEPGNFGDPLGVNQYTPEMRMKELNNGRMAMMSVLGIFAAEFVTGDDAIQQFGILTPSTDFGL